MRTSGTSSVASGGLERLESPRSDHGEHSCFRREKRKARWMAVALCAVLVVCGGGMWLQRTAALESGYLSYTVLRPVAGSRRLVELYQRLRGWAYYHWLAKQLTRGARDDRERINRCLEWTYLHVRPQLAAPSRVVADDAYRIAKRGFGYCDQSAHVFCTLAFEAGVPARMYFLRDDGGQSHHTVAQVWLDAHWVFVDTLIGRVLEAGGSPLTLEGLRRDPSLLEQAYIGAGDAVAVSAEEFVLGEPFQTFPYARIGTMWKRLLERRG